MKVERSVLTKKINDNVMLKMCINEMMRIFRTKTKFMKLVNVIAGRTYTRPPSRSVCTGVCRLATQYTSHPHSTKPVFDVKLLVGRCSVSVV